MSASVAAVSVASGLAADPSLILPLQGGLSAVGDAIFGGLLWLLQQWYWLMDWVYYFTGLEMLNPRYRFMHRAILVGL